MAEAQSATSLISAGLRRAQAPALVMTALLGSASAAHATPWPEPPPPLPVAAHPMLAQAEAPAPAPGPTQSEPQPAEATSPAAEAPVAPLPGRAPLRPDESPAEPRVQVSEVVIEGIAGHPERERIEAATYGAMTITPGNQISRSDMKADLAAIYATGWFSDVRITPQDTPLGVRLLVIVVPNPVLQKITLEPPTVKLPPSVVQDTFSADIGKTLNLNTLKTRLQDLQKWYADQGFSLARVTGPSRVSPEGEVLLTVREGSVNDVEVQFLNKEGSDTDAKGKPVRGKTKLWVITREISIKKGQPFNRRNLEEDLKRLYGTGLFSDVKVTLRPVPGQPGEVDIVLGIVEQSTGSLSGGLGYSQSQGVFGQVQVQDSNLFGRAWDIATSFTYGQFGGLADISFTDPWIKGDPYRTAFRARAFISRDVPQVFQSQDKGTFLTVEDSYKAPGTKISYNIDKKRNPLGESFGSIGKARAAANAEGESYSWFDFDGNSIVIQRIGGNIQFVRPMNGGNPYKSAPWTLVAGLSAQQVKPINFAGESMPFGVASRAMRDNDGRARPKSSIICIAYNCATENQLVGVRLAATMSTLNNPRNPTSGNFFSFGTEQFISVGPDSPTFNRIRTSFTHYIPVNWLKIFKGCRPKPGETPNCSQALAFQVSAGTNLGDLPTYEAFCIGGGNSVRGYYDCDLGVAKTFGEATIEYRFPLFSIVSGELFIDGGTAFGTQRDVPGNPGEKLRKPGNGYSVGTGLIVTTPVGPLRLEVASQDFTNQWRFNLGVGWKF